MCVFPESSRAPQLTYPRVVFRVRWINAKCALEQCREELIILRFEMQMCYLSYRSRAKEWMRRRTAMKGHRAHEFMAVEYAGSWSDMAAYAQQRFNHCIKDVIHKNLRTQF